MDVAVLALFHDSGMVRNAISVPVEENDHSRLRRNAPIRPLVSGSEPLDAHSAARILGDNIIQIAALVGTPADKAGAPFNMLCEAIPSPIGFPSHIANLGSGNLYNQACRVRIIENLTQRIVPQHMGDIVHIAIAVPAAGFGSFQGKLYGVGFGVFAVLVHRPGDVALTIVIALQRQLDSIYVHRTFALSYLQAVGKILNTHIDGIFRVGDSAGGMGIQGVKITLGALHGIGAPATGFLHHHRLNQKYKIRDSVFLGILLNDRFIIFHLITDRQNLKIIFIAGNLKVQAYKDMLDEVITKEEYTVINARFTQKLEAARKTRQDLLVRKKRMLANEVHLKPWMDSFKKHAAMEALERSIVVEMIERICVYSKDHIEIHFQHEDEIREMMALSGVSDVQWRDAE